MSAVNFDNVTYFKGPNSGPKNHIDDRVIVQHQGYTFFGRDFGSDEFVLAEMFLQDTYGWFKNPTRRGLVIDIGANIGAFAVPVSKTNFVVAFEPERNNLAYLKANKELNNSTLIIEPYAVGKPNTTSTINDHNGGSTLGYGKQPVTVIGLDDIIDSDIDFLKMDCEGGEFDAFEYASDETIKKIKRFAMEVHKQLVDEKTYQKLINKLDKFFVTTKDLENGRIFGVRRET